MWLHQRKPTCYTWRWLGHRGGKAAGPARIIEECCCHMPDPPGLGVESSLTCSHIFLSGAYTGLHGCQPCARLGTCSDCNRWALPLGAHGRQVLRNLSTQVLEP